MTINQATLDFIAQNRDKDVQILALKKKYDTHINLKEAIQQIAGRQKIKEKVPQFYANEQIRYPVKLSLEQSSSQITALHKAKQVEGKLLIDLTGGFGIDSYFFSQQIDQVIYVEKNEALYNIAQHNFKALQQHNIRTIHSDAHDYLRTMPTADWIYIDPARRGKKGERKYFLQDLTPNILTLLDTMLLKSNRVMCKLSPMIDITLLRQQIPTISEIHIVAVKNECKELLAIIDPKATPPFIIKTFDYKDTDTLSTFQHREGEEKNSPIVYANQIAQYLYEPNTPILKGGLFAPIAQRYNVQKLHPNSHLYTSDKKIDDFPGRRFNVMCVYDFNKKGIKAFTSSTQQSHIATRNFPLSAPQLQKKLHIKDGGDSYTFGTTIGNHQKILIKTTKSI